MRRRPYGLLHTFFRNLTSDSAQATSRGAAAFSYQGTSRPPTRRARRSVTVSSPSRVPISSSTRKSDGSGGAAALLADQCGFPPLCAKASQWLRTSNRRGDRRPSRAPSVARVSEDSALGLPQAATRVPARPTLRPNSHRHTSGRIEPRLGLRSRHFRSRAGRPSDPARGTAVASHGSALGAMPAGIVREPLHWQATSRAETTRRRAGVNGGLARSRPSDAGRLAWLLPRQSSRRLSKRRGNVAYQPLIR